MALLFLAVGHLSVSYLWNQGSRNPAAVIRRVLLLLNLGKLPGPQLMSTSDSSSSKSSAFRSAALFSTIGVWRTIGSVTCGISLKFPPVGQSRAIRLSLMVRKVSVIGAIAVWDRDKIEKHSAASHDYRNLFSLSRGIFKFWSLSKQLIVIDQNSTQSRLQGG